MIVNFEPFDCAEIGSKMLAAGLGSFKIISFEKKISRKAEQMIQLNFMIKDCNGKKGEWEMFIVPGNQMWKFSEIFKSLGMENVAKTGAVDFNSLINKTGRCEIFMKEYQNQYGAIKEWHDVQLIPHDEERKEPILKTKKLDLTPGQHVKAAVGSSLEKVGAMPPVNDFDDDIPF